MALTVVNTDPDNRIDVEGSRRVFRGTLAFDSSYPTGGEAITAATFGLSVLHHVQVSATSRNGAKLVTWDNVNSKLQVWTALTTQAGDGTDQSSVVVAVTAVGT